MNVVTVPSVSAAGLYALMAKDYCFFSVDGSGFETLKRMQARVVSAYRTTLALKDIAQLSSIRRI